MKPLVSAVLCLAAAVAILVPPLHGQDDEEERAPVLETRVFDVSRLTRVPHNLIYEDFGLGWPAHMESPEQDVDEPEALVSVDTIVELVQVSASPESWEVTEGAFISPLGSRLTVRAEPKVLAEVGALLTRLEAAFHRDIESQVRWMTFDDDAVARLRASGLLAKIESGMLERAEARAVVLEAMRTGNTLESGSSTGVSGQRVAIRKLERVTFLKEYDVEIAQGSQIADPIVETATGGLLAYVTPRVQNDGEIAIDLYARAGKISDPIPTLALEASDLGTLDLPEFAYIHLSVSGSAANGRALASALSRPHGPDGPALGVVLVSAETGAAPARAGGLQFFDVSFLTAQSTDFGIGWSGDLEDSDREFLSPRPIPLDRQGSSTDSDSLVELLLSTVDPESWEKEGTLLSFAARSRLVMKNDKATVDRARATLAELERAARRAARFDVRIYSVPDSAYAESGELLAPGARPNQDIRDALGRMPGTMQVTGATFSGFLDRWTSCAAGVERSYVRDYDVEVAQEARISDPRVAHIFSGVLINAWPRTSADGKMLSITMSMRHEWVDPASIRQPERLGTAVNGVLQQPRSHALRISQTISFPRGGCSIIDGGKDPMARSEGRRLVIVVGAR